MLVGVAVLIPLILGYTGWAYWVFRGKVQAGRRVSLMPVEQNPRPLAHRLLWFAALWLGGVGAVADRVPRLAAVARAEVRFSGRARANCIW